MFNHPASNIHRWRKSATATRKRDSFSLPLTARLTFMIRAARFPKPAKTRMLARRHAAVSTIAPFPFPERAFPVQQIALPVHENELAVPILREFARNALTMRGFQTALFAVKGQNRLNSLFFSLLTGIWPYGDRFCGTASTTRKSAQIDVIS